MATLKVNGVALILVMAFLLQTTVETRPLYRNKPGRWRRMRPWNILGQNAAADLSVAGLEYYVQIGIGQPNLQQLIPVINTTTSNSFGLTQLFALNVTEAADPSSTQLGYVRGYTVQASYTTVGAGVEVEILQYNDGTLNGTVSIQGLIFNGPTEVAVVGGTGDFRGASGYGIITFVNATDTYLLFHHQLHFL